MRRKKLRAFGVRGECSRVHSHAESQISRHWKDTTSLFPGVESGRSPIPRLLDKGQLRDDGAADVLFRIGQFRRLANMITSIP